MDIKEKTLVYEGILEDVSLPHFAKVYQRMDASHITDIYAKTREVLTSCATVSRIKPGDSVCIACGSRDIAHITRIVKAVVDVARAAGGEPFLVPAMGSHGGATAEGQREVLLGYGLTEECVGAPIRASMETVKVGQTPSGMEVQIDKNAAGANHIILIARIKPHTDFRGPVESGIMKMITIGLGKQHGASLCHAKGYPMMSRNIREIANIVIDHYPQITGIGILENAFHETFDIIALVGKQIDVEEPVYLERARQLLPKLPFEKCDALFVDEMGKNISGPGMDPNITGRSGAMGRWAPDFDGIAVLDLTDFSHGNGNGIGNADVITQRCYEKFDMDTTYVNAITALEPNCVKLPMVMPNDKLAMKLALRLAYRMDQKLGPKVVWIHNTLCMHSYFVSEALIPQCRKNEDLQIVTDPMEIRFDSEGSVIPFDWT